MNWFRDTKEVKDVNDINCIYLKSLYNNIIQQNYVLIGYNVYCLLYDDLVSDKAYYYPLNKSCIDYVEVFSSYFYFDRLYKNAIFKDLSKSEKDNIIRLITSGDSNNVDIAKTILGI